MTREYIPPSEQRTDAQFAATRQVGDHEVMEWTLEQWQLDAASYGVRWLLRLAKSLSWKQDSALVQAMGASGWRWSPGPLSSATGAQVVKWFAGPPARLISGTADIDTSTIWVSAELKTWEDVVKVSAHEAVHGLGVADEHIPTVLGRLAAKAWAGVPVYIHDGQVSYDWIPPEAKGDVHRDALVLEYHQELDAYPHELAGSTKLLRRDGEFRVLWNKVAPGGGPWWVG